MNEFRFPKIVIRELVEEEGRTFSQALTSPICDFCFDERVKWSYACSDFDIETSEGPWGSYNGWAVCDPCSELIEALFWSDLTSRIIRSWAKLGVKITIEKIEDASLIVNGFVDNYTPERFAFG